MQQIILGCGCFWSKQFYFDTLAGVISTHVGFAGGDFPHPDYKKVCTKTTGHAEVTLLTYDSKVISLPSILDFFFSLHDATIDRRSRGGQYRSLIGLLQNDEKQAKKILDYLDQIRQSGLFITTEFHSVLSFFPANGRHQKYCETRSIIPKPPKSLPIALKKPRQLFF